MTLPEENEQSEYDIVNVRLPRSEYNRLKNMLERERAYDWLTTKIKTHAIWIVGGGILTLWILYDKFQLLIGK